jgi:peroxiredoxin
MKKTRRIALAVLVTALAGALYLAVTGGPAGRPPAEQAAGAPLHGRPAPAFSLADISGNIVPSSRFAGKPTVVNFFATWCPACEDEVPGFVQVYNRYRERGLELVGIALDTDTRGNLPAFIASHRIEYKILLGDLATVRAYGGVSSLPTTVFIGKDGEIKKTHVGFMDERTFEREVRKLF